MVNNRNNMVSASYYTILSVILMTDKYLSNTFLEISPFTSEL